MIPPKDFFKVYINCKTFNQGPFILDALNGFAAQRTDFPFLAIVIDDASTDGEQGIIDAYISRSFGHAESSFLERWETDDARWVYGRHDENVNAYFLFLLLKHNLFRNPKKKELVVEWMNAKYVAMCEGDDYWTDSSKLQRQVDFLEQHIDYSLCFTNCFVFDGKHSIRGHQFIWDTYTTREMLLHNSLGTRFRRDQIVSPGHTSTILYRVPSVSRPAWISKCFIGDEPFFIWLSTFGKAKFMNTVTSTYRKGVGVSSANYSCVKDNYQRIRMYKLIDKGLDLRYHNLISYEILTDYYYLLVKRTFKQGSYFQAIRFFFGFLVHKLKIA